MLVKYFLWDTIIALAGDNSMTEIPAGAVVEGPSMMIAKGTVTVRHRNRLLTVLALDLLNAARVVTSEHRELEF